MVFLRKFVIFLLNLSWRCIFVYFKYFVIVFNLYSSLSLMSLFLEPIYSLLHSVRAISTTNV